jgi:hypothetical protein
MVMVCIIIFFRIIVFIQIDENDNVFLITVLIHAHIEGEILNYFLMKQHLNIELRFEFTWWILFGIESRQ